MVVPVVLLVPTGLNLFQYTESDRICRLINLFIFMSELDLFFIRLFAALGKVNYYLWLWWHTKDANTFGSICLSIHLGLWERRCAPPQWYRTILCTTPMAQDYIVHHWPALCTMVHNGDVCPQEVGVVHNVALYWLGGPQDDFACLLSALTMVVHNMMLSV